VAERVVQVVIPYSPREIFKPYHASTKRFSALVAHRRAGKTVAPLNKLIKGALTCPLPSPRFAYIAPLFTQAKDIAWSYVKHFTGPIPGAEPNESELRVDLPNGGRVRLYGADNPERLRGLYFDGVVLDEYGSMRPSVWDAIVRPALSDRLGWADFCGTPNGRNHFCEVYESAASDPDWYAAMHKASQTGIIPAAELEAARKAMSEDMYEQEYECSFEASVIGAYYGKLMREAEDAGRITRVPYEATKPVETWWDLGVGDSTAIWFVQRVNAEIRLIDYYEMTGEGLGHYAKVLQAKPYVYGQHVAPHDIEVRELGTGKTRRSVAADLGLIFVVAPNLPIDDGISAARTMIPKCWFDAEKCKQGIESLRQYKKAYDERLKTFRDHPLHDWASHGSDAFRYGAVSSPPPSGWGKPLAYNSRGIV
jgi:phage terminase large subunit